MINREKLIELSLTDMSVLGQSRLRKEQRPTHQLGDALSNRSNSTYVTRIKGRMRCRGNDVKYIQCNK